MECKELDGCVKININCCGNGDSSNGSGIDGKSAYEIAVENGFVGTELEWQESLVGKDGEQGPQGIPGTGAEVVQTTGDRTDAVMSQDAVTKLIERPWCSGYFKDRTMTASVHAPFTPIVNQGDSSLISGYNFVAPENGVYRLSTSSFYVNTASSPAYSVVFKNADDPAASPSNADKVVINANTSSSGFPAACVETYLETGEFLTLAPFSTVAQTSIYKGHVPEFVFSRVR